MITTYCPISGIYYGLAVGNNAVRLTAPHPILSASVAKLADVEASTPQDYHLLFTALVTHLASTGIVTLSGAVNSANFSTAWIKQELPHLLPFTRWVCSSAKIPQFEYLAQFRIDAESTSEQFQTWRKEIQLQASKWDTLLDASIARELKLRRELALAALDKQVAAASPKIQRARARLDYLRNSLEGKVTATIAQHYVNLVSAAHTYEVYALRQAKEYFLDYLPDTALEDYNDKQEIIQLLDAAIVEKVGLAAIIGIAPNQQELEIVRQIRRENVLFSEGQEFITASNKKLNLALAMAKESANTIAVTVYEHEPQRAEYKTQLGYMVAHKQWTAQQTGGQ